MPIELILLLLAFALVANALLVALAVRQVLDDPERRAARNAAGADDGRATEAGQAIASPAPFAEPEVVATEGSGGPSEPADGSPVEVEAPGPVPTADEPTAGRVPAGNDEPADATPVKRPPAPRRAAAASAGGPPRTKASPAKKTSARRPGMSRQARFTLPAMTEDPERAERAIEAFLTGGRPPAIAHHHDAAAPRPKLRGGDRRSADMRTASVAIVAVTGYRGLLSGPAGDERGRAVDAAVETTLRRAARVGDHVVALGDGRFRILLVGSSESAANAYLDRVRTMCRPWLQAAAVPLDLVTAAAEAGDDGDLAQALRIAERRLVKAGERPRASGEDGASR